MSTATAPMPLAAGASAILVLGPELTIGHADACRATLAQAVADSTDDLRLDLSSVSDFDSSAIQLLLATRRSLAEQGRSLDIVGASDTIRDALTVFGLTALLPGRASLHG